MYSVDVCEIYDIECTLSGMSTSIILYACNLQTYLTEEDFQAVFGISVHDFKAMPVWKQANLKKKVDLF